MQNKNKYFAQNAIVSITLLIMILLSSNGHSQVTKNERFNNNKNYRSGNIDSIRVYLDSAQKYAYSHPLLSADYINHAIELSILNNDYENEARAYLALGNIQQSLEQHGLSIVNYKKSIQAFTRDSKVERNSNASSSSRNRSFENEILFNAYVQTAISYKALLKYDEANSYINKAFSSEFNHLPSDKIRSAQRVKAAVQADLGQFNEAHFLLNNVLNEEKLSGNASGEIKTLLEIGKVYKKESYREKAADYFSTAKSIAESKGLTDHAIQANNELAVLYRAIGDLNQEVQARNSNIAWNNQQNNSVAVSQQNIEIGNAYLDDNQVDLAEGYFNKGIENIQSQRSELSENSISEQTTFKPIPYRSAQLQEGADAYRRLAEGFLKQNNFQKAINYYKQYSVLQDSVEKARELELEEAMAMSSSLGKNQQRIDLLEKERELSDKSMEILRQDRELKGEQLLNRNIIIGGLGLCMILMLITAYFMIRNTRARRKADKLLTLQSLSGQMNPHFIFNALNSVNEYISQNDERAANRYLSSFSKLMRQVMDDSRHTFIPLSEEIEMLKLYLQLEHARFQDKFDYSFQVSDELANTEFSLPPMIVQPFLENAIWHGLRYGEEKGKLDVRIELKTQKLVITISDNGIGLKKSKVLKTQNQKKQTSLGMQNIHTRVALMNDLYHSGIQIEIEDFLPGEEIPGTLVTITIPQQEQDK